ncbi:caspase family protein [Micromonospora sp. LOL_015]|uniref:caspase family protein n=1 Tax=Micromonospora sp. LOL_015 TaxID=3345416 RepID=UPI003A8A9BA2
MTTQIVAIALGASSWPNLPAFESSSAFSDSADALRAYLRSKDGLHLADANILWLFGSDDSVLDQYQSIRRFIQVNLKSIPGASHRELLVIIYYIGHGGLFGTSNFEDYCLIIRSSIDGLEAESSFRPKTLASVVSNVLPTGPKLFILDCCFAGKALSQLQSSTQQQLNEVAQDIVSTSSSFQGVSLLCASGPRNVTKLLNDSSGTAFTSTLLRILRRGDSQTHGHLSARRICQLIREDPNSGLKPEVHSPVQSSTEVADLKIFPNRTQRPRLTGHVDPDRGAETVPLDRIANLFASVERSRVYVFPRIDQQKMNRVREMFGVDPDESIGCFVQYYTRIAFYGIGGILITTWGLRLRHDGKVTFLPYVELVQMKGKATQYSFWRPVSTGIIPIRHTWIRIEFFKGDDQILNVSYPNNMFGKRDDIRIARLIASLPDLL